MVSAPHPATVANVAVLLASMEPTRAADGMRQILAAIRSGLEREGWPALAACEFALTFGEAVVDALRSAGRPVDATLH